MGSQYRFLASQNKKSLDVGANLFIGNLDTIMRDPDTGNSRGFGFISYDSFEASDAAIEAMNGQYLCNRQITVSYAYKKDTKGQRHGNPAERVLAASNPSSQKSRPHTLFASGPPILPSISQTNATVGAPVPPSPFANGVAAPATIAVLRPPVPPNAAFPPMHVAGQPTWQGQPPQPGQAMSLPVMPPPPTQAAPVVPRPPPQQMGVGVQPQLWRPPPPQHLAGAPPVQQMMMQPPPPANAPPPPPPFSS